MAFTVNDGIDGIKPLADGLIEIGHTQLAWYVAEIVVKVVKCITACHLAAAMTSHAVGQCCQIAIAGGQVHRLGIAAIPNKLMPHKHHVFIVLAYTAYVAGCMNI